MGKKCDLEIQTTVHGRKAHKIPVRPGKAHKNLGETTTRALIKRQNFFLFVCLNKAGKNSKNI